MTSPLFTDVCLVLTQDEQQSWSREQRYSTLLQNILQVIDMSSSDRLDRIFQDVCDLVVDAEYEIISLDSEHGLYYAEFQKLHAQGLCTMTLELEALCRKVKVQFTAQKGQANAALLPSLQTLMQTHIP